MTISFSDAGLAFEGEALGKLAGVTPEEEDRTFEALHTRLLALVAGPAYRNADRTNRIQVLIRGDRKSKWKYVQRIMQICADPAIQVYKLHFKLAPTKPADSDKGASAK